MSMIPEIVDFVRHEDAIYIQAHNYPDHDAVASAFALQRLLAKFDVTAHIIYEGDIQRDSLKRMIRELNIEVGEHTAHDLREEHSIIVVDGCKGNKNVTDLIGEEIAVIDHHAVTLTEDVRFVDIRPEYGSCSTIIFEYYREAGIEVSTDVATALMIGINMDTALLTRGVSKPDVQAYADLYTLADTRLKNSILRNYIQTKDLEFYRYAMDHVQIADKTAFCYFPDGCGQNLLGILGDFFLSLREADFVILCAHNGSVVNFSIRSEREEEDASLIIQEVLSGIGFGGGHKDMAGGIIKDFSRFDVAAIQARFNEALESLSAPAPDTLNAERRAVERKM